MSRPYDPLATLQAASRDRDALARLVEEEQCALTTWLERVLRDGDLAQEAAQETWLILSRGDWSFAARTADAAGDVRAWLRQIALRAALRMRGRQRTQQRHLVSWFQRRPKGIPAPTPLERLADRDRQEAVWALVADLPPTMRESVELRFRDGLDFAEIGRSQGCTALAARVRTWRGLAQMRRWLLTLGILAVPGSLMAALGGGSASGMASSGFLDRWGPAVSGGAGHAPLRWAVMGGGMLAVVGWCGIPVREAAHEPSPPVGTPVVQVSSMAHASKPGSLPRVALPVGVPAVDPQPHLPEPRVDINFTMQVLLPAEHFPFDATRPTILTADEREHLLASFEGMFQTVITNPDITWQSRLVRSAGQPDLVVSGPPVPVPDSAPTRLQLDDVRPEISVLAEANGIRISDRPVRRAAPADAIGRTERVKTDDREAQGRPAGEPDERSSQTVPLPAAGILIPPGGSLLLPTMEGRIEHATPGGITTMPDPGFRTWWLLITPSPLSGEELKSLRDRQLRLAQNQTARVPPDQRLPSVADPPPEPEGANEF